jgi:hypothetical protein
MRRLNLARALLSALLVLVAATAAGVPQAAADRGSGDTTPAGGTNGSTGSDGGKAPGSAAPTTAVPSDPGKAPAQDAAPTSAVPATPADDHRGDNAAAQPTLSLDTAAAAPELGTAVGVAQADGRVVIRTAEGRPVQGLVAGAAVPVGTHIDARQGTVALASAVDARGTTQVGRFSGAIFEVRQAPGGHGVTQVVLLGGAWGRCHAPVAHGVSAGPRAVAAARKRKPVRSLWGSDDHGRFQTRGRGSVATVRGTRWLTEDYCDGTLTRVTAGAVAVRDLARHTTVLVTAGHSYFARVVR